MSSLKALMRRNNITKIDLFFIFNNCLSMFHSHHLNMEYIYNNTVNMIFVSLENAKKKTASDVLDKVEKYIYTNININNELKNNRNELDEITALFSAFRIQSKNVISKKNKRKTKRKMDFAYEKIPIVNEFVIRVLEKSKVVSKHQQKKIKDLLNDICAQFTEEGDYKRDGFDFAEEFTVYFNDDKEYIDKYLDYDENSIGLLQYFVDNLVC